MVLGNLPKPLDRSHRKHTERNHLDDDRCLRRWDAEYRSRASLYPAFVICRPLFLDLSFDSPVVEDDDLLCAFGEVPRTQNPGVLAEEEFRSLLEFVGVRLTMIKHDSPSGGPDHPGSPGEGTL
jgi:hypothetical protein